MRYDRRNIMAIQVKPRTLPIAGTDVTDITIEETYDVKGIGTDTVLLRGTLVSERTVPLLEHGRDHADWESATVVARFTTLNLFGKSDVFGPVLVRLDEAIPSFGIVTKGKCKAALGIEVSMPDHQLVLRSETPVQLHSVVETVPPIGDERTEGVLPVRLLDVKSGRPIGTLAKVRVAWRELIQQTPFRWKAFGMPDEYQDSGAASLETRLGRVTSQLTDLLHEVDSLKRSLGTESGT
jgi:hypothetical protein